MKTRHVMFILFLFSALLYAQVLVHAQSGAGYDLTWNTVDGGGWTFSTGGGYMLGGTIGQPDAGSLSGGGYTLNGGLWYGIFQGAHAHLPLLFRRY